MRALPSLLLAAAVLHAQPADEILALARHKIIDALDRLPKYTCVETLNRDYFKRTAPWPTCSGPPPDEPSVLERSFTDRFRLDVTVTAEGREIYSWAGAREFDANSLKQLVARGAVSTGSFGPFLINIFGQKGVEFAADGREQVEGRTLLKFRYRVPKGVSRYDFQVAGASRFIPYDGAFWIDPAAADLVRLEVHTTSMPHESGNCEATTNIDFQRAAIGGNDYMLPRASRLEAASLLGHSVNETSYSACREYGSESVIRFDGGDAINETAAPKPNRERLPGGLRVTLALNTSIDTRTAAAGDRLRAHVVNDVIDKKSKRVLAPAGAVVEGRIVRLEHEWEAGQFLIAIEWQSLMLHGAAVAFTAVADPRSSLLTVDIGDLAKREPPARPDGHFNGAGLVFDAPGDYYVVSQGYESHWVSR